VFHGDFLFIRGIGMTEGIRVLGTVTVTAGPSVKSMGLMIRTLFSASANTRLASAVQVLDSMFSDSAVMLSAEADAATRSTRTLF
jgi:hypothetical protein